MKGWIVVALVLLLLTFPAWGGFLWCILKERFGRYEDMVINIPSDGDDEETTKERARKEVLEGNPAASITGILWFYDRHLGPYAQVSYRMPKRR